MQGNWRMPLFNLWGLLLLSKQEQLLLFIPHQHMFACAIMLKELHLEAKKKMCFLKIRELLLNLTPQSSCSTSNISSVFSNFQHVLDAFCLKYITISIFCKLSSCCFSFEDRSFMCTLLQKYRKLF